MGRIYEERGAPVNLRWFWSLHGIISKPLGHAHRRPRTTLEDAKDQFEAAWRQWLAWAKLREM